MNMITVCPLCHQPIKDGDSHGNVEDGKLVCHVVMEVHHPRKLGVIHGTT